MIVKTTNPVVLGLIVGVLLVIELAGLVLWTVSGRGRK